MSKNVWKVHRDTLLLETCDCKTKVKICQKA